MSQVCCAVCATEAACVWQGQHSLQPCWPQIQEAAAKFDPGFDKAAVLLLPWQLVAWSSNAQQTGDRSHTDLQRPGCELMPGFQMSPNQRRTRACSSSRPL